jgi:hypothetical protein
MNEYLLVSFHLPLLLLFVVTQRRKYKAETTTNVLDIIDKSSKSARAQRRPGKTPEG